MTYLDDILAGQAAAVELRKAERPLEVVAGAAHARTERRAFAQRLRVGAPPAIIAEFKRSSPSAGAIDAGAKAAPIAVAYERGGAAAVSVLTEAARFGGGFEDLQAVRAAVELPALCKDFILEEYQVYEAVAQGADAVLLIVAALDDARLAQLVELSRRLRVETLVEAHDEREVRRATAAGAQVIGINNRDLHSFEVDLGTADRLRASMPDGCIAVAESGYRNAADVARARAAGYDAVLVGEALMRCADPAAELRRIRSVE